jgi:type II secretory pathway pseudopilin PulG
MTINRDNPASGRFSEAWWSFVAADLEAQRAERQRSWGDIDEMLLVRYEAGVCTEEERARVEQAMRDFPAVRESIEIGRELVEEWQTAAAFATQAPLSPSAVPDGPVAVNLSHAAKEQSDAFPIEQEGRKHPRDSVAARPLHSLAISVLNAASFPGRIVIGMVTAVYRKLTPRPRHLDQAEASTSRDAFPAWTRKWPSLNDLGMPGSNFRLVELLISIGIAVVGVAILIPPVLSAREAARRAQCSNNLKQIGLAAANYESANNCFPSGSYSGTLFNPPHVGSNPENFSCFVRMLPFFEQEPMYNAVNFNLTSADPANLTISGVQVSALNCPSDLKYESIELPGTQVSPSGTLPGWNFNQMYPLPPGKWNQAFTSYSGNAGTFTFGFSNLMPPQVLKAYNGVIYNDSSVRVASITDGTSATLFFGERSKGHSDTLDLTYADSDNAWNSGRWDDTLFSTLYPVNLATSANKTAFKSKYSTTAARSYHPGGAFFAFGDGSVKFLKNSIDSWSFKDSNFNGYGDLMPDNTTFVHVPSMAPYTKPGDYLRYNGAQVGIYQQLSTCASGDIVSSDSY